MTFRNRFS